ncbi:hypothetical protein OQA88_3155 [Cercophora sp. LCS_1]
MSLAGILLHRILSLLTLSLVLLSCPVHADRERLSLNRGWRFQRSVSNPDKLAYDRRPDNTDVSGLQILKPWILPTANDFIKDPAKRHKQPSGVPPGSAISYTQSSLNDSSWELVDLPHDWAIKGPFYVGDGVPVGGGMGRLPSQGVGWYRRKLTIEPADKDKTIYLDMDGAMSYAIVWLNGQLVGGWPYGYNSFRLNLTPHLRPGSDNLLAIRVDNPVQSSRWYPGGGIYRNVWLTKVSPVHVAQYGTYITTSNITKDSAVVSLSVTVTNTLNTTRPITILTTIPNTNTSFPAATATLPPLSTTILNTTTVLSSPILWNPWTQGTPHLYNALTTVLSSNQTLDSYTTPFGIRTAVFNPASGLHVNGILTPIRGVNQHHDLGALGAAYNHRAAQRQLEILRDLGSNALRMSHNPPAPELLDLADSMGFIVINEIFDCWVREKNPNDFHLIFADWSEPDLRNFIRRDRNHPSIVAWSVGNEVGEQYTDEEGALVGRRLSSIAHEEDPTRPATASMNYAKPDMPFPREMDILNLNYQGEGIRDAPAYAGLEGIKTPPLYEAFQKAFPNKFILSSETAAALSTRGTYLFPVTNETSAPTSDAAGGGGSSSLRQVSAYELHTTPFGSSADKVFATQDRVFKHSREFVWSGWDYLGEPTPYYSARSSYFGIIDLAGFKKDRYHLYQARWRPDLKTAHILPHWTWPDRVGQVTPVHVFTAADEAELFVNGKSQGRLRKEAGAPTSYRFRWDKVVYAPGELLVATYKDAQPWANATVRTVGPAAQLRLTADRSTIRADGHDLSFVTVEVVDANGDVVPRADTKLSFALTGPGSLAATDNGDPADMTAFVSKERKAFNGLALAIVRGAPDTPGSITITASASGLPSASITLSATA